ncbi:hypothetical protein [Sporisorium scitamineum]|uniref:Uncharacterized protein n=1 Tax=Sporisorium scitamineum TaxID=49012 RepID=A0A0F7RYC5_9BASI|nr:hypothetical protein [Sporisorium scitamineum]
MASKPCGLVQAGKPPADKGTDGNLGRATTYGCQ